MRMPKNLLYPVPQSARKDGSRVIKNRPDLEGNKFQPGRDYVTISRAGDQVSICRYRMPFGVMWLRTSATGVTSRREWFFYVDEHASTSAERITDGDAVLRYPVAAELEEVPDVVNVKLRADVDAPFCVNAHPRT